MPGDVIGVDDVVEAAAPRRSRSASRNAVAAALVQRRAARGRTAPAIASALSQSAWTSTGLPIRGVTTQSPTFASIQVSCTPGTPAASSPSLVGADAVARAARVAGEDRRIAACEQLAIGRRRSSPSALRHAAR